MKKASLGIGIAIALVSTIAYLFTMASPRFIESEDTREIMEPGSVEVEPNGSIHELAEVEEEKDNLRSLSEQAEAERATSAPPELSDSTGAAAPVPNAPVFNVVPEKRLIISKIIEGLPVADFFYTIPDRFKSGSDTVIKAGIANEVTEELLRRYRLQDKAKVIRSATRYEPLGTEILLWVSDDAFKVEPIGEAGKKPVIEGNEQIWSWNVTPLKAGSHDIIILAKLEVSPVDSDETYLFEYELYEETHQVSRSLAYSTGAFISNNDAQLLGLILAPGSLGAAISWWITRKKEKAKAEAQARALAAQKQKHRVGFIE